MFNQLLNDAQEMVSEKTSDNESVSYEDAYIYSLWDVKEYVYSQMEVCGLDRCEHNIGNGMSLPVEEAVAIPAEVDVENLNESQQDMYYIMDTLADCCYYDVYAPNDPNFFGVH